MLMRRCWLMSDMIYSLIVILRVDYVLLARRLRGALARDLRVGDGHSDLHGLSRRWCW